MAKTERQRRRRKQNRKDFESNYFHGGKRLHTAPLTRDKMKGVSPEQVVSLMAQYPKLGFNHGNRRTATVEDRGHGKYNAAIKGQTPIPDTRQVPSRHKAELKKARKLYRSIFQAWVIEHKLMKAPEFDHHFKAMHPKEYRLYTQFFNI